VAALVPEDAEKKITCDINAALEIAAAFPERRLITGSLYFAGEVLAHHRSVALEPSDQ
jgi:folylpolyglutamate synthase/dihydropteroate synthase